MATIKMRINHVYDQDESPVLGGESAAPFCIPTPCWDDKFCCFLECSYRVDDADEVEIGSATRFSVTS